MKTDAKTTSARGLSFPYWAGALRADDSLSPGLRESYRRTLMDFLKFCQRRRAGATVALAREYMELARLEQAPSPARLQEWKDGFPQLDIVARSQFGQESLGCGQSWLARQPQKRCPWRFPRSARNPTGKTGSSLQRCWRKWKRRLAAFGWSNQTVLRQGSGG